LILAPWNTAFTFTRSSMRTICRINTTQRSSIVTLLLCWATCFLNVSAQQTHTNPLDNSSAANYLNPDATDAAMSIVMCQSDVRHTRWFTVSSRKHIQVQGFPRSSVKTSLCNRYTYQLAASTHFPAFFSVPLNVPHLLPRRSNVECN
jgi:hypothetical protein